MSRYFASLLLFIFLYGCESEADLMSEANRKKGSEELVSDVRMKYTDSGKIKVMLKAPTIRRFEKEHNDMQEFIDGIYTEFYDDSSKLKATLTADYAIRDANRRTMTARNNVKLVSAVDKTKLESEELIWDESRAIIYTHKFFKWTKDKEIGTGFFFEADQSFKKIKMRATEADNIEIPGFTPTKDTIYK